MPAYAEAKAAPVVPAAIASASDYQYELDIPAIGVDAGIVGMGVGPDGRMSVPANLSEVGWYAYGAKPGAPGTAVLGAHVDNGAGVNGVFKDLKRLAAGDGIFVKSADGSYHYYRVTAKRVYDRNAKNTAEIFIGNGTPRLAIITCYGKWLPKEKTYQGRLVVFADLL